MGYKHSISKLRTLIEHYEQKINNYEGAIETYRSTLKGAIGNREQGIFYQSNQAVTAAKPNVLKPEHKDNPKNSIKPN